MDNQSWQHTQVCSLEEIQSSLEDKCTGICLQQLLEDWSLVHKGLVHKDRYTLVLPLKITISES